jgi:hypothetical protein
LRFTFSLLRNVWPAFYFFSRKAAKQHKTCVLFFAYQGNAWSALYFFARNATKQHKACVLFFLTKEHKAALRETIPAAEGAIHPTIPKPLSV